MAKPLPVAAVVLPNAVSYTHLVITSANPFKNIPDYPEEVDLMRALESLPHVVKLEIEGHICLVAAATSPLYPSLRVKLC